MSAAERGAGIVLLVLSLTALLFSLELGISRPVMPGAGLFPLLAALALGVSSAVWLWQRARALFERPDGPTPQAVGVGRAAALAVAMALFAVLLKRVGFLASAILLMSFTAYVTGERRWAWILGVAVVGSVAIGSLFGALGAQLP